MRSVLPGAESRSLRRTDPWVLQDEELGAQGLERFEQGGDWGAHVGGRPPVTWGDKTHGPKGQIPM